jgi:predicted nucleotidyltransferase
MNLSYPDLAASLPHDLPLLFASISGAHLYGFPSPDSDLDVRGCFVLPLRAVLGLEQITETTKREYPWQGYEVDFVAHDLRKFVRMLLHHNGYALEQLYSPLVVQSSPAFEELRALGRGCITRDLVKHYRGFAHGQWQFLQKQQPPTLKSLLYVYRVLLTGIHVLTTGEVEANLRTLNEHYHIAGIDELIARKIAEAAPLAPEEFPTHEARVQELFARLERAHEQSSLPQRPTSFDALNEFVIRIRQNDFQRLTSSSR